MIHLCNYFMRHVFTIDHQNVQEEGNVATPLKNKSKSCSPTS